MIIFIEQLHQNMSVSFHKMTAILYVGILCLFLSCMGPSHAQSPLYSASDRAFHHFSTERYKYNPKERNLNYDRLIRRMGDNFDSEWMAVNKPVLVHYKDQFDNRLINKISRVNFTYVDDNGEVVELKDRERKVVEKWLLKKASCPVRFTWEDLSEFFWPRWIKTGSCDHNKACSWPSGMRCVPADSRSIRILHWRCSSNKRRNKQRALSVRYGNDHDNRNNTDGQQSTRDDYITVMKRKQIKRQKKWEKRNRQKMRCHWKKVRYPVTTQCYCSC